MRRGGGDTAPPGPSETYGPTLGAASVRAGVGARTVADPGGGISFNSSGSLQSAINANPTSSTFVCSVSSPVWNSIVFPGTKRPTIIFPGAVGQKVIDGTDTTPYALNGGEGVTVKGGTWQNFVGVPLITGNDWVVQDARTTSNGDATQGGGVSIQGLNLLLSHCTIDANTNQGMDGISGSHNLEVEYCDIYGNNTAQLNPGNQGGAFKILAVGNGHFHHNYVHDNLGFGMWWDTNAYDWLIEENVSENNSRSGFFWEASYGSVIRRNYFANNGRNVVIGGQAVSPENTVNARIADCKADVTNPNGVITPMQFTRNIVDQTSNFGGNTGALMLLWDHSATAARHTANVDVFENQFWLRSGMSGLTQRIRNQDTATGAFPLWTLDNNYFSNEYRVTSGTTGQAFWMWDTGTGQGAAKTYTQWQTFHPSDNIALQVI